LAAEQLNSKGIALHRIEKPSGNYRDAMEAGRELVVAGVEGVVVFLGAWMECSVAMALIREVEHLPLCLWGFPMFMQDGALQSTGSYVSYAMFKGSMDRAGYRYKAVLGLPDDMRTLNKVAAFCRAAGCAQRLKRTRIGLVGYTSMNIYPGTFDHLFLRVKIGPDVEQMDSYTLIREAENCSEEEISDAVAIIRNSATIKADVTEESLRKAAGLLAALQKVCGKNMLHAMNVKCQYEFSKEYKMVMCVPLSALAEQGIVSSCEGDMLNTVSMMILNLITGETVTYGDAINHMGDVIKLSSCGFLPFSLGRPEERTIGNFMPHPGFTGIQCSFVLKPGRVTVMRLVEDRCDYHIIYFTGEGLETELRQGYMPALDVRIDGDMEKLTEHYAGQHFAICYGDVSQEIEDLAGILGIRAIRM
jgi:L-fucose isomerase-like protein